MSLTNQEIEQLQQQLKEKKEEVKAIYDQLLDAGAVALSDDFLDAIAGGCMGGVPTPTATACAPTATSTALSYGPRA